MALTPIHRIEACTIREPLARIGRSSRLGRGLSLRVLMVTVAILGGGFGWLAYRARLQRETVFQIVDAGGKVEYDWEIAARRKQAPRPQPPWPRWFIDLVGHDYLSHVAAVYLTRHEGNNTVDDALLARIGRLDRLESLSIEGHATVTDDSLSLLQNLKRLRKLRLFETGVKGPGLRSLTSLTDLRDLELSNVPLTRADLATLKGMTSLESLTIAGPAITDAVLEGLASMTQLRSLAVQSPQVTNAGLNSLRNLDQLTSLTIDCTQIDTLRPIEHFKQLKTLIVLAPRIDDDGLAPIAGFRSLEFLAICRAPITDAGLVHLAGLTQLQELQLNRTAMTDAGLAQLASLVQCRSLYVHDTQVTPTGVAALAAKKPSMKIFSRTRSKPPQPRRSLVDSIIFQPRKYVKAEWPALDPGIEDVWFKTSDGLRLNGWFAAADQPRAVVLYAHGNGGNIAYRREVLRLFRDRLGCSVLMFDYRGYGLSEGNPSESGVLIDARSARKWLAERAGVAEREVVLVGHSLGGGVVVDLAARDGARGLILENTFTSLPDVAARAFKLLPVRLLVTTRLDSLSKIPSYHGPLLQTHGEADLVIPFELGERLFDAAHEPKQFIRVPGGGHNDPPSREYVNALDRFLGSLPALGPKNQD